MHLTNLGIEINGDGGKVFYMAIIVFVLSLIVLWINRKNLPFVGKRL
jgi:cell division protein FtsL